MCDYLNKNNDVNDYHWKVLNLYKMYAESEMMDFDENGTPRVKGAYAMASPKNFIKDINVPILLVHGKADKIVPSEQAAKNYELAKSLGKDVRLKIVPGESVHNPPEEMLKMTNLIGEIETAVEIWRFLDRIKREVYPENYDGRPTY
jgi:dipeptidyl aminopeptidase/acylaminoacyl peptidase